MSSSSYGSVCRDHVNIHSNLHGICFGYLNLRYDNQLVGPSTCLMIPDSSNSSKILSSFSLFENGVLY